MINTRFEYPAVLNKFVGIKIEGFVYVYHSKRTTNRIATAAITIKVTPNSVYALCELLFCARHCKDQPEYLKLVTNPVVPWLLPGALPAKPVPFVNPVLLKPGKLLQFVLVCTLPSICTPMDSIIAIAMKAPTSPMIVLDSAILRIDFVF